MRTERGAEMAAAPGMTERSECWLPAGAGRAEEKAGARCRDADGGVKRAGGLLTERGAEMAAAPDRPDKVREYNRSPSSAPRSASWPKTRRESAAATAHYFGYTLNRPRLAIRKIHAYGSATIRTYASPELPNRDVGWNCERLKACRTALLTLAAAV